jgi:hypothetical protein
VIAVDERGELPFELFDASTEDELGGIRYLVKGAVDLLMDRLVLRNEIDEGDYSGHPTGGGSRGPLNQLLRGCTHRCGLRSLAMLPVVPIRVGIVGAFRTRGT